MLTFSAVARKGCRPISQLAIVGHDAAGVTIGAQVFPWIKGKGGRISKSPDELPLISGEMRLGTVFDHPKAVFLSDGHDRVHVGRLSVKMNWNDAYSP